MDGLNRLKEQELKEKLEKEQIKRSVKDLDKDKLNIMKRQKEEEQERVAQEVQLMKRRERELKEQVERLEGEMRETQKIYEENARKVNEQAGAARQVSDQENVKRRLFEEKAQRIADLKARQNNLVGEKAAYEKMEAELRAGQLPDRENMARVQERVHANAERHVEDIRGIQGYSAENMRDRVERDQRRLEELKRGDEGARRNIRELPGEVAEFGASPQSGMTRPMSKKALAGQAVLDGYDQGRHQSSAIEYNPGYNPSLDILNQREEENRRLQEEVDNLRQLMENREGDLYGSSTVGPSVNNTVRINQPRVVDTSAATIPRRAHFQQAPMHPPRDQYSTGQLMTQPPQPRQQNLTFGANSNMSSGPKDFDDFLSSNFMQNQMKNVDLNEDERMLVHLTMMEADSLRMLSRIPQNTELYRFKLEQYKELSTQRAEAEKIVQETRLKKIKRALELRSREDDRRYDNQKFLDEVRKQTVANQLVKEGKIQKFEQVSPKEGLADLNPKPKATTNNSGGNEAGGQAGEYNMNMGFVAHWDYVFGIPKNKKFCQLVYAIMNGEETVLEPQMVDARPVQDQNVQKNQCVIYENTTLREIEPNKFSNLILEVQMPLSLNNVDDYVSLGWTFLNLFDVNGQLNRGKFKLPLYQPPIYRNVSKEAVDQLKPVLDCSILFRISYPWKDEYSNLKNLEPHLNHRDYLIPSLHIKQASLPGVMATNLFGAASSNQNKQRALDASRRTEYDNSGMDYEDDTVGALPAPARRRPETRENGVPSTTTRPETPHELIARSKGVKVGSELRGDSPRGERVQAGREGEDRGVLYEQPVLHERRSGPGHQALHQRAQPGRQRPGRWSRGL